MQQRLAGLLVALFVSGGEGLNQLARTEWNSATSTGISIASLSTSLSVTCYIDGGDLRQCSNCAQQCVSRSRSSDLRSNIPARSPRWIETALRRRAFCKALSVAGTTVTAGTAIAVSDVQMMDPVRVTALGPTTAIACWSDFHNYPRTAKCAHLTVSGTAATLTKGSTIDISATCGPSDPTEPGGATPGSEGSPACTPDDVINVQVAGFSASTAAVCYARLQGPGDPAQVCRILTVSGTTLSAGAPLVVNPSAGTLAASIAAIGPSYGPWSLGFCYFVEPGLHSPGPSPNPQFILRCRTLPFSENAFSCGSSPYGGAVTVDSSCPTYIEIGSWPTAAPGPMLSIPSVSSPTDILSASPIVCYEHDVECPPTAAVCNGYFLSKCQALRFNARADTFSLNGAPLLVSIATGGYEVALGHFDSTSAIVCTNNVTSNRGECMQLGISSTTSGLTNLSSIVINQYQAAPMDLATLDSTTALVSFGNAAQGISSMYGYGTATLLSKVPASSTITASPPPLSSTTWSPPPPPAPSPPPTSSTIGDPHITFAHGGTADFRGSHRDSYAFVSSPGYQFAPHFEAVDFWWVPYPGFRRLIHGTFMTAAEWRVRTPSGRVLLIRADALRKGELHLVVIRPGGGREELQVGSQGGTRIIDDVKMTTAMYTCTVETARWSVKVTSKPIWGFAPPPSSFVNSTHFRGVVQRRLDLTISGAFPQPDAHGVIGQSYRNATAPRVNGKHDAYGQATAPGAADADGVMPSMTTSAQAEGAIEGVYTDYRVDAVADSGRSTRWKYSRFEWAPVQPEGQLTSTRVASTREYEGEAKSGPERRLRRRLHALRARAARLQRMAGQ